MTDDSAMSELDDPTAPQPVLAVVGRPNVGKSTLVNRILGRREAVVEDVPGVTRDRVTYDAQWRGLRFTVVDTGGGDPDAVGIQKAVAADLARRDRLDSSRPASPLQAADDAVHLDSSTLDAAQVVERVLELARRAGLTT